MRQVEAVPWGSDFEVAKAGAGRTGRLVLLSFVQPGRPAGKALDEETFADPGVLRRIRDGFVPVRLDPSARADLFAAVVGGRGAVATAIVGPDGDVVSVAGGYLGPKALADLLDRAAGGIAELAKRRAEAPASGKAMAACGDAYHRLGSPRRAEECWKKASESTDPEASGTAHARLARLRVERGKNLEARRHLEAARRSGGSAPSGSLALTEGLILGVERRHAEAARVLEEALKTDPAHAEKDHVLFALGFVLHQDKRDREALAVLERLMAEFPASGWALHAREQAGHIRNPQPDHEH